MWRFLKQLLAFRVAQKSTRGAARMLGFKRIAMVLGLIGGFRAMKRHRHA
jgi:hypothetical protein